MAIQRIGREWCPCADGYKEEFICDTDADVADLPKSVPGSSALVADGGNVYIVNASGEWVKF